MRTRTTSTLLLCAALLTAGRLLASSGVVFDDRGGTGVREPGAPGIAAVEVSNGLDVVQTDANGAYTLPDRPGARVFVIKPRGWASPAGADRLPLSHSAPGAARADFPLRAHPEGDTLRVLVMTDPQPATPTEVGYFADGLLRKLGQPKDLAFGVILGDVVYDRPDLFPAVNRAVAALGLPWHALPGNHDLSLGTPDESAAVAPFEASYGPSTYAFHAGPALFVALDDVRPQGGPRYVGGLRPDQFEFLAHVLALSPRDEWVVLMVHIPLFQPYPLGPETFRAADRLRLFGMLKDRPRLLILSGHTHYQRHVIHDRSDGWDGAAPLHEYNVAAACGGYWSGPKGPDGVPSSTMWDGTPPGYAVVGFGAGAPTLDYVPALLPATKQMQLHVPRVLAPRQGYVPVYANVFNGHDGWTVESRVDDRAWGTMTRTLGWDPSYAAAYLAQDAAEVPAKGTRLPEPVVCYHLWRGILPADLPPGRHVLQVRARPPGGEAVTDEEAFEIASP